jgi:hypothetical protein
MEHLLASLGTPFKKKKGFLWVWEGWKWVVRGLYNVIFGVNYIYSPLVSYYYPFCNVPPNVLVFAISYPPPPPPPKSTIGVAMSLFSDPK